ncbi:hypothetical protein HKX48_006672 [Thoreauomyces humboldtii]|nr:hypothetical protein HKX48_006672 [Thoreauomyces humboldtii]
MDTNAGSPFRGSTVSDDLQDWSQRWRVVTSTKTRVTRNIILHAICALFAFLFALTIGTTGRHTDNGERLCVLRANQTKGNLIYGDEPACRSPVIEGVLSMVLSIAVCAYNVHGLVLYRPRPKRTVLALAVVSVFGALWMFSVAVVSSKNLSVTCADLKSRGSTNGSCSAVFEGRYPGNSYGALVFGLMCGFLSAIAWGASAFREYKVFKAKELM